MAAGSTYTPIATTTLASSTSSYTFTSIPSTYTDLVLVCNYLTESTNQQGYIRFNNDSGANYNRTVYYGTSSSNASFRQSNQTGLNVGMTANTNGTYLCINIMNYANTSMYKTCLGEDGNASGSVGGTVFLWKNSAAINSISITSFDGSSSIQAGAIFTLYGIQEA